MAASRPAVNTATLPVIKALQAMQPGSCTAESVRALISNLLDAAGLDYDQRVDVLGGALIAEAVRPYWEAGHDAESAHELLRSQDEELADMVEAVSPVLLARAEAQYQALDALAEVNALLGSPRS